MSGDISLGRIAGVPFRLHWSWFLAVFLIAWSLSIHFFPRTLPEYEGQAGYFWLLGVTAALGLFASILLHELGHVAAAKRFGIQTRSIRLFVFGGVAELGGEPKKPSHEIIIALAGPAVTVLIVAVAELGLAATIVAAGVSWEFVEGAIRITGANNTTAGLAAVLFYLGWINTLVLVFNLVPAFPLDGGRVFRGIVWAFTGNYLTSTRVAAMLGIGFAWLLYLGGFLLAFGGNLIGGVWFFFLGMFLHNAAQASVGYAQLQQLLRGVRVGDMMRRHPVTVDANQSIQGIVDEYFLRYPYKVFPVVDNGRFVGLLTLRVVQETDRQRWNQLRARDLAVQADRLPILRPDEPILQALRKLAESGASRVPVVENEELVGLLCTRDVMDFMEVRGGLSHYRAEISARDESA